MKLKKYPRPPIHLLILSTGLGWGILQLLLWSLRVDSSKTLPEFSSLEKSIPVVSQSQSTVVKSLGNNMAFLPVLSPSSSPKSSLDTQIALGKKVSPPKESPLSSPKSPQTTQGGFRVSNRSPYPIRVALLSRHGQKKLTDKPSAHWDFAPREGSRQGLVLSLPDSQLKLKPGDILVAFAQDGSRRYWGPYIVGESTAPVWNPQTLEWQFIIE